MTARRRALGRRDDNEREIVAVLERVGCTVCKLDGGDGRPDLLVGYRCAVLVLMEIKSTSGKLEPLQVRWHAAWKGPAVEVARSVEDAIDALGRACARVGIVGPTLLTNGRGPA